MVNDFIVFSLKSAVIFSLLFLPYYLLRGDTFFSRNRFYLLFTLILSLVLPLINFSIEQNEGRLSYVLSTVSIHEKVTAVSSNIEFRTLLINLYLIISCFFLLRFFVSVSRIILLILRNPREKTEKETIVWVKEGTADFSFFNYIFLSRIKYHPCIHEHERIHSQRMHSVDIILFELFRCFQWFNPIAWVALIEIKTQHEYEADELSSGLNKNEYQALLLTSVLEKDLVHMTNSFYYLTIKKRFSMMNKKRSPKKAWNKTLAVLPFVLLSVGLFAHIRQPEHKKLASTQQNKEVAADTLAPEFKGGNDALPKYLAANIKYPEKARKEKISGMVVVSFTIDKNGKVKNALVKKGVSTELDKEALRVISAMPAWTPGSVDGKAIESDLCIPIQFRLD